MIVEERLVTYLHSLEQENSEILEEIEQEALRDSVPIIRKEMQSFLTHSCRNLSYPVNSRFH